MIQEFNQLLKTFGLRNSIKYSLDGTLEERVKAEVLRNPELLNLMISWSVTLTLENGVAYALDSFNGGVLKDCFVLLSPDEQQLISSYFIPLEKSDNSAGFIPSKSEVNKKSLEFFVRYLLNQHSWRGLTGIVESFCYDSYKGKFLIWRAEDKIKKILEARKCFFTYPVIQNLEGRPDSYCIKMLQELKTVSDKMVRLLSKKECNPEVKEAIIRFLAFIGHEDYKFFIRRALKGDNERIIAAGEDGFNECLGDIILESKLCTDVVNDSINRYWQLKTIDAKKALLEFVEGVIIKYVQQREGVMLDFAPTLKIYGKFLKKVSLEDGIISNKFFDNTINLLDRRVCFKIMLNLIKKEKKLQFSILSISAILELFVAQKSLEWPLNMKSRKTGLTMKVMKHTGVFSAYRTAIEEKMSEAFDSAYISELDITASLLLICPEYSLNVLDDKLKVFKLKFRQIDKLYKAEYREVESNFREIFSDNSIEIKKQLIEKMKNKSYCGKDWRRFSFSIKSVEDLKKRIISMMS